MTHMLLLVVMILSLASRSQAQAPPADHSRMRQGDFERISADLETVKDQLAQILSLLKQRPPGQAGVVSGGPVRTSVGESPTLGRADAPVTVVEFSDYQCPFCQRFFVTTLPVLKKDYVDPGKVRYVFRDFPLEMHPQARKAAEAAHCAGEQGKYWEMHDVLFENQRALALPQLTEHARSIGLNERKFEACLSSGRYASRVDQSIADGTKSGVHGTPGFVIGKTKVGSVVEGTPIRGAQPPEVFRRIIDQLLADRARNATGPHTKDSKTSAQPGDLPE